MLNYKNIANGILTGGLLLSFLTGCKQPQQEFTNTSTPTPTLEQVITQTPQARDAQANPTPTSIPFIPTPFPHDEKSGMPLDSRLAFVAQDQDYVQDIWILNGSEVRRMTHNWYEETDLSWSPDGKILAYVENNFHSNNDYLKIIDVETGKIETIYTYDEINNVSWHPKKDLIVFQKDYSIRIKGEDGSYETKTKRYLEVINPKTGEITQVAKPEEYLKKIEWGQNEEIWFMSSVGDLYVADLDGEIRQMGMNTVDWFDISPNKEHEIVKLSADESLVVDALDPNNYVENSPGKLPTVLSNGDIINFTSETNEQQNIYLIKRQNGKELFRRELLANYLFDFSDYVFLDVHNYLISPNENQLIFSILDFDHVMRSGSYLLSFDGRHLRNLNFGREYPFFSNMHSFAWSPVKEDLTLVSDEDIEIVDNYRVAQPVSLGENIVFLTKDDNDQYDIWTHRGNDLQRLTNDTFTEREIILSPSGEEIFYFGRNESNDSKNEQFSGFIMDLNGENRRQVFDTRYDYGIDMSDWQTIGNFDWSPDGNYLSFLVNYKDKDLTSLFFLYPENHVLSLIDLIPDAEISSYDWSPDGKKIIMTTDSYMGLYDVQSETYFHLVAGDFSDSKVEYSPDGKKISIDSDDGFNNRLYVGLIDDRILSDLRVIEENYSGNGSSWSPDSQHLVYSVFNKKLIEENLSESTFELYVNNLEGTERKKIHEISFHSRVPGAGRNHFFSPKFSPDGDIIMFREQWFDIGRIYAVDLDGNNMIQFPFGNTGSHYGFTTASFPFSEDRLYHFFLDNITP